MWMVAANCGCWNVTYFALVFDKFDKFCIHFGHVELVEIDTLLKDFTNEIALAHSTRTAPDHKFINARNYPERQ